MSRMGNKPILIPEKTEININKNQISIKGPHGEINLDIHRKLKVEKNDENLIVKRVSDDRISKSLHGVTRKLLINAIEGVNKPFEKQLEVVGIGYKVALQGNEIKLSVGYSNPVIVKSPENIQFKVKKNIITVSGIDKQKVGLVAAKIREIRQPEPYKGKGIKYSDEIVKRKPGKAAKTASAEGK